MKKLFLSLFIICLLGSGVFAQVGGMDFMSFKVGPAVYLDYIPILEELDMLSMLRVGLTVDLIFNVSPMFGIGVDGGLYLGYISFNQLVEAYGGEDSTITGDIGIIMADIPANLVLCINLGGGLKVEVLGGVLLWGMAIPIPFFGQFINISGRFMYSGLYVEAGYAFQLSEVFIDIDILRFGVGFLF